MNRRCEEWGAPAPRFIYKPGTDRVKLMSSIDLITPDIKADQRFDDG